jgi:hypothetical protein
MRPAPVGMQQAASAWCVRVLRRRGAPVRLHHTFNTYKRASRVKRFSRRIQRCQGQVC